MSTDIRIATSFKGHRKRKKANFLLGLKPSATDFLLDLWISTAQNHPDGILTGMDETEIALEAGWEGDPKVFVDAIVKAGFLDHNEGCYRIHDWEEHQSWVYHSKERSEAAKRAVGIRWERALQGLSKAEGIQSVYGPYTERNTPSPSPNPSPNPSLPPDFFGIKLASLLFDLIRRRKPDFKSPDLQRWGREIDLLIRRDGRTPDRVEAVIRWCQDNPFWQNNILSPAKLRKQFDQLELKMQGSSHKKSESSTPRPVNKEDWY